VCKSESNANSSMADISAYGIKLHAAIEDLVAMTESKY